MIPMTPSSSVAYRELEGEEGTYWPSSSPGVPLSTSGDEGTGAKVRKPYTITKQRERWTEEEHQKFLEALKLYGRAWRRIEEHIGTKTAVQIRSHAQKFFSKIERDVTQQGGAETGVAQVIDIPPPRPKRKPTHPYPRKAGRSFGKTSEDDCPLAAAGSISSSSGISTANIIEGSSKGSVWEQDDTGEACHQDVANKDSAKVNPIDGADASTRRWGIQKPANTGSSPVIVAPIAIPPASINQSAVPVAFPATIPWARIFGGTMSPAMMNPAMMSPALVNPALMNPAMMNSQGVGMMLPWAAASGVSNVHGGLENGGAASAIAATIAAASAWWAMQGGMPPGVMHPALGAMYLSGGHPLAIPTPYVFSQCPPQEITAAAAAPCGDAKEGGSGSASHVGDDGKDTPSATGNTSRSSALRRAERAQRVKELKARRMGSGNHLLSVSSDICASTSGGSGTNLIPGQVTPGGHLSSESAVNSLSRGVSLPANLNKAKQAVHDLVRKDREMADGADEGGEDKRKRLRFGGSALTDTVMAEDENFPSTAGQALNAHLEKVRSISGSNNLSGQFAKILKAAERSSCDEETTPTDASQSCGSDGSEGAGDAHADGSERRGPSSNSSACGNAPGSTDRSGSSDGSSEGEATCNPDERLREPTEKNGRSASHCDGDENSEGARQFTFNEFLPVSSTDGEKYEKPEGGVSLRLPRTASVDGEQRKEVTERGQIAFQALFKRDTLPRTFSPPPGSALAATDSKEACLPKQQPSSVCNMPRSRSASAIEARQSRSPRRSRNPDSAFNTWDNLRGTSSASKLDRCESGVSVPSSRPTETLEELQSSERRRNNRKGRTHAQANNWLQLAPTSSLENDEGDEDESADSGADDRGCEKQQQQESFVCKLDLSMVGQDESELNDGSDTEGPGITGLALSPRPTTQSLSLSIGSFLKRNSSTVCSVSNRTVKYSGAGFVPYQRALPLRVESPVEKNC